jgi:hypothetical protein
VTLTERERQTDQNKIENEEESSSSNKMKTKMKILDFFFLVKKEKECARVWPCKNMCHVPLFSNVIIFSLAMKDVRSEQ